MLQTNAVKPYLPYAKGVKITWHKFVDKYGNRYPDGTFYNEGKPNEGELVYPSADIIDPLLPLPKDYQSFDRVDNRNLRHRTTRRHTRRGYFGRVPPPARACWARQGAFTEIGFTTKKAGASDLANSLGTARAPLLTTVRAQTEFTTPQTSRAPTGVNFMERDSGLKNTRAWA